MTSNLHQNNHVLNDSDDNDDDPIGTKDAERLNALWKTMKDVNII